jgi:hypothetical protein
MFNGVPYSKPGLSLNCWRRFILSRDCRRLLADDGVAAICPRLFRAYVEQFNWAYRDGDPALRFIQSAFLFTLYLLRRYGEISRPQVFL